MGFLRLANFRVQDLELKGLKLKKGLGFRALGVL